MDGQAEIPKKQKLTFQFTKPGEIRFREAYRQGKMLNNGSWELPRNITPSDIDLVFDDRKYCRMLFVELSKTSKTWSTIYKGQKMLYAALVANGIGATFVALCYHEVPEDRDVDTRNDIASFQIMYFAQFTSYATSQVYDGSLWPKFVDQFYAGKHFHFR